MREREKKRSIAAHRIEINLKIIRGNSLLYFISFFFYLEYVGRENISTYFTLVKSRVKLNYHAEYLRQNVARN